MSKRPATVSVVMAAYNVAQFAGDAIASVLAQTHHELELHFIDDGSTDGTSVVADRFRSDPRFNYHWQPNAGQTAAKNAGIARCSGEYVAFCDADDEWAPEKLALQLPLFDRSNRIGVVYGRKRDISLSGEPLPDGAGIGEFHRGVVTEELFKVNFIPFGTAIVRRGCLTELGVFDTRLRMGIDWELWLRLSTRYEFDYVDEVVYLYRRWPGQMSTSWSGRYEHAFRIMSAFVEEYPGLVSRRAIRDAYAHSYYNRGRLRALQSGQHIRGIADSLRAIGIKPTYWHAWKLLARIGYSAITRRR